MDGGEVLDVAGVGFGPANLALAIALDEFDSAGRAVTARFFEAQKRFGWHRGMLIEGATMQVSFLKDLVTMRNPTSRFSFLSFLHSRGRMVDFANTQTFFPLRVEFHEYLSWAAEQFEKHVSYRSEVTEIRPTAGTGVVESVDVSVRTGALDAVPQVHRARNVVIAAGGRPRMPAGLPESERIWHSSRLLDRADAIAASKPSSFVVLGSGQSAAECVDYLHGQFKHAQVHSVHSRYGYSAADDSAFTNTIFNPEAVDHHFQAPESVRKSLYGYHANTNYSVVDEDLIRHLYQTSYLESVTGRRRLNVHNVSRLVEVTRTDDRLNVVIEFLSDGSTTTIEADALVCATGYVRADPKSLLGDLLPRCRQDGQGRLLLDRNRRVVTDESVKCGIYALGYGEHSHGLSESLLSLTAVRAGELAEVLTKELA
ncbi:lysine N(6)-hydroxylase/L-ornithine N(5)-oxygenase family protein [Streptomyces avicenniae]|uniref:lysine N(6)-hydroxylase/L-ornithine N(5)-oxygenase family protein n=1 Tax=Streptomyces avicenniae TaxID=500153 RepID=UPI001CBA648F|nr:SidA/IucD/PvdA family monooxygenase [Streptomyces avicenniae]